MCLLGDTCKIPDKRDRPKRIKVITRAMKIMNNKFNKNETIKKNEQMVMIMLLIIKKIRGILEYIGGFYASTM